MLDNFENNTNNKINSGNQENEKVNNCPKNDSTNVENQFFAQQNQTEQNNNSHEGSNNQNQQNMNQQNMNNQNPYYYQRNDQNDPYNYNPYGNGFHPNNGNGGNGKPPKKNKSGKAGVIAAGIVAGVLIIGGSMWAANSYKPDSLFTQSATNSSVAKETEQATLSKAEDTSEKANQTSNESIDKTGGAQAVLLDVSDVVEEVMPSVVAISLNLEYTTNSGFFGQQVQQGTASGSGVIIGQNDEELLIVTNAHVVSADDNQYYTISNQNIAVTFYGDSTFDAYIKGTDDEADLAVIAVKLSDLDDEVKSNIKIATVGDSDECKVGNGVIAIGNALGYGQSTTVGYISALNRQVTVDDNITRTLLQTDAAINPGNSGGGLFNTNGELIGINAAKYADEEVEGIGYAIPISSAESIINELMNKVAREPVAEEKRGMLGIQGGDVPTSYVTNYNYPQGAFVSKIVEGTPAYDSDLQVYDIITAVNGESVKSFSDLQEEITYYEAGTAIELTVQRTDGRTFKEYTISVTLAAKDTVEQSTQAETKSYSLFN